MKAFLFFFLITAAGVVSAQKTGLVTYETKVNVHKHMTGERAKYKEFMPEFKTAKKLLFFDDSVTLYKEAPLEVDAVSGASYRPSAENKYFVNHNTLLKTEANEFMGKLFLIIDTLEKRSWKITGQAKQIGDYPCVRAEFTDTNDTYIAWFTPTIQVPAGPRDFGQLPGLILELHNSDTSFIATTLSIEFKELDNDDIEKPKKGKKVTQEEFREIVRQKMKEMRESGGGFGMH